MKWIFHTFERMPRRVKNHFAPGKEFVREAKGRFLAAFDARYPSAGRAPSPRFAFVFKAAIGSAAGFAVLVGGLSAYADTNNVPADHALYSFKRIGESIRLVFAPPAAKVRLQSALTVRRIDEINDLSSRKPTSTALTGLTNDFNASINSSINEAENDELSDGPLGAFCGKLFSAIVTSSIPIYENLLRDPRTLDRFEHTCKGVGVMNAAAVETNGSGDNSGSGGNGGGNDMRIPPVPDAAATSTTSSAVPPAPIPTPALTPALTPAPAETGGLRGYLRDKLHSLRGDDEDERSSRSRDHSSDD